MSRRRKKNEPLLVQHPATIWRYQVEPFPTPSNDYMFESEWKEDAEDVPVDFFDHQFKLHDIYDIPIETDGTERGFFFSSYSNKFPFYFLPVFFEKYKPKRYYCLGASVAGLAAFLDAGAYLNETEFQKSVKYIANWGIKPENEGREFLEFGFINKSII